MVTSGHTWITVAIRPIRINVSVEDAISRLLSSSASRVRLLQLSLHLEDLCGSGVRDWCEVRLGGVGEGWGKDRRGVG